MPNGSERDAFLAAILETDLQRAQKLLHDGADIGLKYKDNGWTALHFAVEHQLLPSAKFLLEHGANPNQPDSNGWTPLHLAIDIEADAFTQQTPGNRSETKPRAELTALLLMHGANRNARTNDGRSPLDLAKAMHHDDAVRLLTE